MKFYFKSDPKPMAIKVYAKTEFGDIYVDDTKLYIPVAIDEWYIFSFFDCTWRHKIGIVEIMCPNFKYVNYEDLKVLDLHFFDLLQIDDVHLFDEDSEKNYILNYFRYRREKVCYSIVNRGQVWYNHLSTEQKAELNDWYEDWLDVTETLKEPDYLTWLNDKINKLETEELL